MRQKFYLLSKMVKQKWLAFLLAVLLCFLPINTALDFQIPVLHLSQSESTNGAVASPAETRLISLVDLTIPLGITPVQATGGLTVTKMVDLPVVEQGGLLTYTLVVTNNTGADLTNVLITDTVPADATCQAIGNPSPWLVDLLGCTAGLAAWLIPPIPLPQMVFLDGTNASLTYTVRVAEPLPDQSEIVNSAGSYGVSAYQLDSPSNTFSDLGLDDITTTVNAPVWQIHKRVVPTPTVLSGGFLTYTIALTNVGSASTSAPYTVTDIIPTHTTLSDNPDGGVSSDGTIAWILSQSLAAGESTQVSFSVKVTDPLTNNTVIVNDTYAITGGNVLSTAVGIPITVTSIGKPILTASKVDSLDPVLAGDQLIYTITVTNSGTITASTVVVTDTLDVQTSFISANPGPSTSTPPSHYTFNLGSIAPGTTDTIIITTTVSPLANHQSVLLNNAIVTAAEPTAVSITETTTVNAPTFSIAKSVMPPGKVRAGDLLTYTIHYTNNSPIPATNIRITDTMPVSIIDVLAPLIIDAPDATVISGTLPTLVFARAALVNNTGVITIVGQVITSPWTAMPLSFTNQVSATFDENPTIYSTSVTSTGEPAAPVQATYAATPVTAVINTPVTITTTLTDQYNNPVVNGTVVSFTTTLGTIGDAVALNGQAVGTLNSSIPGTTTVQVGNPGVVGSGIVITYTAAALAIEKTVNAGFASLGDMLVYTITVTNTGDTTATNVMVTDNLPTGVSIIDTDPPVSGGTAPSYLFDLPSIPPTMTGTLHITASVALNVSDGMQLINQASATSAETITSPSTAVTTTVLAPNFRLAKSVVPLSAAAGDTITYTITYTSDGSLPIVGLHITDTLPLSLTNMSVTSDALSLVEESAIFPSLVYSKATPFFGTETITITGQIITAPWSSIPTPLTNDVTATVDVLPGRIFADQATTIGSSGPPFTMTVTATPTITNIVGNSAITAQIIDRYGNPITDGQSVQFSSSLAGSDFNAPNPTMSSNGFASAVLTAMDGGVAIVTVQVPNISNTTVVTFTAPDLAVSKTSDRDRIPPGGNVAYTIVLTNTGDTPLTNLSVTDLLLNSELQFVSATPAPANTAGQVSRFSLSVLNPGLTQTIVLTAAVAPDTPLGLGLENLVSVTATEMLDPVRDDAFIQVAVAALDLSTTIMPMAVSAGETLTYTIIYTNNRAIPITNIRLTDELPHAISNILIDPGNATVVDNIPNMLVLTRTLLPPDASDLITITGQVFTSPWPSGGLSLTNVVTATSDQDIFGAMAQATSQGQPGSPANLTISTSTLSATVGSRVVVTATLTDQYQNPVYDGILIDFGSFGSVTTTGGAATIAVSSAIPGPMTVTVTAGSLTEQVTLTFVEASAVVYLPTILKTGTATSAADLIVEAIDISPLNPKTGEPVVISVTVKNIGAAPASRFWVDLYLTDTPVVPDVNDLWPTLGDFGVAWLVPDLGSGQSVTLTNLKPNAYSTPDDCQNYSNFTPDQVGECNWPNNNHRFSAAGTYYVTALADSFDEDSTLGNGNIAESNENNNGYVDLLMIAVTGAAMNGDIDQSNLLKQPAYNPIVPGDLRPPLRQQD